MTTEPGTPAQRRRRRHAASASRVAVAGVSGTAVMGLVSIMSAAASAPPAGPSGGSLQVAGESDAPTTTAVPVTTIVVQEIHRAVPVELAPGETVPPGAPTGAATAGGARRPRRVGIRCDAGPSGRVGRRVPCAGRRGRVPGRVPRRGCAVAERRSGRGTLLRWAVGGHTGGRGAGPGRAAGNGRPQAPSHHGPAGPGLRHLQVLRTARSRDRGRISGSRFTFGRPRAEEGRVVPARDPLDEV